MYIGVAASSATSPEIKGVVTPKTGWLSVTGLVFVAGDYSALIHHKFKTSFSLRVKRAIPQVRRDRCSPEFFMEALLCRFLLSLRI